MKSQVGFSLLEVIVTSVISTLLAGPVLTMLYLSNSQIKDSLAHSRLSMKYEVVAEEIHRVARKAHSASPDEAFPLSSPWVSASGFSRLIFFDETGNIIGGLRILDGYLLERKNGIFQTFKIGTDSVLVTDHNLAITAERRSIHFRFTIADTAGGASYELSHPREIVLCRNNTN